MKMTIKEFLLISKELDTIGKLATKANISYTCARKAFHQKPITLLSAYKIFIATKGFVGFLDLLPNPKIN